VGLALLVITATAGAPAAWAKRAHIVPLGGHGTTAGGVVLRGRALAGKPSSGAKGRGRLRKTLSTAHAFLRNDLEHVEVVVADAASGQEWKFSTDGEGFFDATVPGPLPAGARRYRVTLGAGKWKADPVELEVPVVDAAAAGLVVVCDIDDTIVETGVADGKTGMVLRVAASSADDMRPYPAAAATLAAFAEAGAPIVYVSAGPVELAPRTTAFLGARGFPSGALFLRHYEDDGIGDPTAYKRKHIDRVLADYPARKLVLVGDNGEHDPDLFAAVAKDTGRVAAAYVRATLPVKAGDPRYDGLTVFSAWTDVARHAGKAKLLRWLRVQRILAAEGEK